MRSLFGDSAPLTSRLQGDCMHMGSHTIHPTNKTSLMLLRRLPCGSLVCQTHGHFVILVIAAICSDLVSSVLRFVLQTVQERCLPRCVVFSQTHRWKAKCAHPPQVWDTCWRVAQGRSNLGDKVRIGSILRVWSVARELRVQTDNCGASRSVK